MKAQATVMVQSTIALDGRTLALARRFDRMSYLRKLVMRELFPGRYTVMYGAWVQYREYVHAPQVMDGQVAPSKPQGPVTRAARRAGLF